MAPSCLRKTNETSTPGPRPDAPGTSIKPEPQLTNTEPKRNPKHKNFLFSLKVYLPQATKHVRKATAPHQGRARHTAECASKRPRGASRVTSQAGHRFALAAVGWSPVGGRMSTAPPPYWTEQRQRPRG